MKVSESLKWVFGAFLSIFIAAYLFNHLSPWLAVVFGASVLYIVATRLQTVSKDTDDVDDQDDRENGYRQD